MADGRIDTIPPAGYFVAVEGPSGIGKTTVTGLVTAALRARGLAVLATKEPTDDEIGLLARHGTADYGGLVLSCLVAADRYHHLERQIRPAVAAGGMVITDRYLPTSLVLQTVDGVPAEFVWQLHRYADKPDLCVILTGDPSRSRDRAERRGGYSRFHGGGIGAGADENRLYEGLVDDLPRHGWRVVHHDVQEETASVIADRIVRDVLAGAAGRVRTVP